MVMKSVNVPDVSLKWVICRSGQFVVNSDNNFILNTLPLDCALNPRYVYDLGTCNHDRVFLWVPSDHQEWPNHRWMTLRDLVIMLGIDRAHFSLLSRVSQVAHWSISNEYCGSCGHILEANKNETNRKCINCTEVKYPPVSPCVLVLVVRDKDFLLVKHQHNKRFYTAISGFVEPGETLEHCAVRETKEEVGLRVAVTHYRGSQSWPFPHALMVGYQATYQSGDIVCQEDEIAEAQWFSIDAVPELPPIGSLSRYLIDVFIAEGLGQDVPKQDQLWGFQV